MFGIEINNLNDNPTNRGTQLLAALDYLTQQSSVRNRLDAALRLPTLKTVIGNAPYLPSGNPAGDRVPTLIYTMQNDTLVPRSRLTTMYNTIPATTEKAYLEIADAGHNYIPSTATAAR